MKKLFLSVVAALALCACSGERGYMDYRGLSLGMSAKAMYDSLQNRGLSVDTISTTESTYALVDSVNNYSVGIYHNNDTITDVIEAYAASYNDSTSQLWDKMRHELELEITHPYITHGADLHKEAVYKTNKGTVTLTLLNTYTPTLSVRYSTHIIDY